ncbi:MAG: GFA family protein [Granulosicoccus sp.]|nr:GFA family protein [Granulosicoccus sp.]
METRITGRCACGLISYECSEPAKFSLICQCRQCQRITGTGHSAQFAINASSVVISGDVKTYELTSDAGNQVQSAFCEKCGSPMYKTTSMAPELIVFHAATLNNPEIFEPQMVVYSSEGLPWDHIDPALSRK